MRGEKEVGISIIEVDSGIDTGFILAETSKQIDSDTTIADLHQWANEQFPELLQSVITKIKEGSLVLKNKMIHLLAIIPEDLRKMDLFYGIK